MGAEMEIKTQDGVDEDRREKGWQSGRRAVWGLWALLWIGLWVSAGSGICSAQEQENPLDVVHTPAPPPPPKTPEEKKPVIEGAANAAAKATSRRDARIRVEVNL